MIRLGVAVAAAFSLLVLAPASADAAPAGQVTGTRLAAALLPPSWFPFGSQVQLSVSPNSAWNSGDKLERGPAKYNLATMSCADFYTADTGFGETAAAGNIIGYTESSPISYAQAVYQFASPAAAAAFFHGTYSASGRCRSASFTIGDLSERVRTQSITAGHAGSYQDFVVDQWFTESYTGFKPIVIGSHILYVLAGADVYQALPQLLWDTSVPSAISAVAVRMVFALIARVHALLSAIIAPRKKRFDRGVSDRGSRVRRRGERRPEGAAR
jgi:hypothetical protein